MIRRHSGSASDPSARVGIAEQDHPQHPLGVALGEVANRARRRCRSGSSRADGRPATSSPSSSARARRTFPPAARRWSARGRAAGRSRPGAGCPRRRAEIRRRAPSSSGCRGSVGGSSTSTATSCPVGREEPQDALAHHAVGLAQTALDQQHLEPEAGGQRRQARHQRADLLGVGLHHRPHVQQHAVPHQAAAQRAAGLEAADRLEHLDEHLLELRQRDDPARPRRARASGRGPRRARTAARPSGSCGRPRGTGRCPPPTGSRSSSNSSRPPQLEPVAHHRVQPAQDLVLDQASWPRAEREQVDRRHPAAPAWLGDGDDDPVQRRRRAGSRRAPRAAAPRAPRAMARDRDARRTGRGPQRSPSGSVAACSANARAAPATSSSSTYAGARCRPVPSKR